MPNAKGYKSFFGAGRQSTLGTVVARTVFSRFNSESIEEVNRVINSARLAPSQQVVEQGLRFSNGALAVDGNYEGLEYFFKDLFGQDTITTPGGATNARLHTFALTDDLPSPGASVEINKGGLQSHLYSDMKIRRGGFSIRANSLLQCDFEYIGRIETLVSASTPTYPALLPIGSAQLVVQIDAVTVGINSFDFSLDNQLSGEDRPDAAGRDIKEPERTAVRLVEGVIELDYDSTTQYNKFKNATDAAITATWTGALIESGQNFSLAFSFPRVRFSGQTPTAGSPGVLPLRLPFRAYETAVGLANEMSATMKNRITTVI
jgi:hypothetical protein